MIEADYWSHLEFRVCREMAGFKACKRLRLWCDGLIPETYALDATPPHIQGRAWIGNGTKQEPWKFTLLPSAAWVATLPHDWSALLPSDDLTEWLDVHIDAKEIRIAPTEAKAISPEPPG